MKPKAVVCGTTFGRIYLAALQRDDQPYQLAGIVARGSPRSRQLAEDAGVPLYPSIAALPDDIALGCVVIRSGMVGGAGTEMAQALLARKISVIQEHPVHSGELAPCLRSARSHGAQYRLNTLYPETAPVRRYLAQVRRLARLEPPLFIDAVAGVQIGCALLDILGHALGGLRPFAFGTPAVPPPGQALPYRSIDGTLHGVPLHLRLQYQMDLRDPDNYFHLMHRITVGFPSGNLCLHDTHGPVLWARRFHVPRVDIGAARLEVQLDAGAVAAIPMVRAIGPSHGASLHAILTDLWPAAIARQLRQIEADQRAQRDPLHAGQRSLDLCLAWEALTDRLGPPAYSSLTSLDRADATAAEAVLLDESAEQTP